MKYLYLIIGLILVLFIIGFDKIIFGGTNPEMEHIICEINEDCKLTNFKINSCCPGCGTYSINTQTYEQQQEYRAEKCNKIYDKCTMYNCLEAERPFAVCENGQCSINWVPKERGNFSE